MYKRAIIPGKLQGARATVIGAARSGMAAARLLKRAGVSVFVTDNALIDAKTKGSLEDSGIAYEEGKHTSRALDTDYVVTSPGVPDTAKILVEASQQGLAVYSEIEVAAWFCQAPIVAITGSNGKTTTTSLLGSIFASTGKTTFVAGNIGNPFSNVVTDAQADDVVVLEVSSFQLDHINSFRPDVSVLLNISPDHMDRYGDDLSAYAESKIRICENQTESDAFIYNLDDDVIKHSLAAKDWTSGPNRFPYSLADRSEAAGFIRDNVLVLRTGAKEEVLMHSNELALRGRHNTGNSLAAAIAARVMEVRSDIVRTSLSSFEGVPHRLEMVREVEGIQYVNDSKATNVNAVWYALESMNQPVILIAGGRDKGNDYEPLKKLVSERVRVLIAVGESAEKVQASLGDRVDQCILAESMGDAVRYASLLGRPGEIVLLSPACASFDMFENFEERGDEFKRLVSDL